MITRCINSSHVVAERVASLAAAAPARCLHWHWRHCVLDARQHGGIVRPSLGSAFIIRRRVFESAADTLPGVNIVRRSTTFRAVE